jgi:hypothetical protein
MPSSPEIARLADPGQHEDHPVGWIDNSGTTVGNMLNPGRRVKEVGLGIVEKETKMVRL